tara:strand:- start:350 stop:640 length:291 start_codon:yes stop_codon:yes gene_type:complete
MIDTDKYEGHTPIPWCVEEGDMDRYGETDMVLSVDGSEVARGVMRQDAQLIADAPLLLQTLKDLKEMLWCYFIDPECPETGVPYEKQIKEMLKIEY